MPKSIPLPYYPATYETTVYRTFRIGIASIRDNIRSSELSSTSIGKGKYTLDIYDIGDEGYNLFYKDGESITPIYSVSQKDTLDYIDSFISLPESLGANL